MSDQEHNYAIITVTGGVAEIWKNPAQYDIEIWDYDTEGCDHGDGEGNIDAQGQHYHD
jgi:hypothetical protein